MSEFNFESLFIYDLANNHQGDLEHALNIVRAMGEITKKHGVRAALKFQFRQIDTFIHPDYKDRTDVPHISRFMSTRLNKDNYKILTEEVRRQGMITICTPFDEGSIDDINELGIELIKIASCSATDRPLLERVAENNKPVVVSTAGLSLEQIDRLVSFLEHKRVRFALMHCVAIYPTPNNKLNLNQIDMLKSRFPNVLIGYSAHEDPENYIAIRIALAKGAALFERHVGIGTDEYKLNAYSSTPEQIDKWIKEYHDAVNVCGGEERMPAFPEEINFLKSLMRGVYAKAKINKGDVVNRGNSFFAMPLLDGQLASGEYFEGIVAEKDYSPNMPINNKLADLEPTNEELVYSIILQVKGLLNNARIFIGKESSIEISHHYGLKRFREYGAVIINCINREYCKKLIVQLPRQKHPIHCHKKKEETFQLLYGDIEVVLDGHRNKLELGETLLLKPGCWHQFHTLDGVIMEEVSTTHYDNDSFYNDERITRLPRSERKTEVLNWEATIENKFKVNY